MAIELNHTIVHGKDKEESARFLTEILGLPPPRPFYHFLVVELANGVSLDFLETDEPFNTQHYAFLVSEEDFDAIFARIKARDVTYWPDPARSRPGEINRNDGGRGLYFEDPGGNLLEIITRPYGSGAG
jgi:catechol 2,3-dioxygenase-like lactoylglutathione lyase family enzyme